MSMRTAVLASLALLTFVVGVDLARADRATRATRGPSRSSWTANGVRFQAERTPWHGGTAAWERRATRKDGTTAIVGKAWGSRYRGGETTKAGVTHRVIVLDGIDGKTHYAQTTTVGDKVTQRRVVDGVLSTSSWTAPSTPAR
jgi:hypothetical protein